MEEEINVTDFISRVLIANLIDRLNLHANESSVRKLIFFGPDSAIVKETNKNHIETSFIITYVIETEEDVYQESIQLLDDQYDAINNILKEYIENINSGNNVFEYKHENILTLKCESSMYLIIDGYNDNYVYDKNEFKLKENNSLTLENHN